MTAPLMDAPQRRHIPGPKPELDAWVSKAELDGSAVYTVEQGEMAVVFSHEQTQAVAAELMEAWDQEERRQANS